MSVIILHFRHNFINNKNIYCIYSPLMNTHVSPKIHIRIKRFKQCFITLGADFLKKCDNSRIKNRQEMRATILKIPDAQ